MTEQGQKRKTHNNSMSLGDDDDYNIRRFTSRNKYVGGYDNRDLYNARGHIVGEYGKEFSSMFASNTDDMIQALDNLQNLSTDLNTLGQSLNIRIDRLVQSEIRLQQLADNYKYLQDSQENVQGRIDTLRTSFNATATDTEKTNFDSIEKEYKEAVSDGKSQTEIDAIIAKISTIPNTVSSELVKQYRELERVRTESVKAQNQFNEESGKVQYEQQQVETEREYVENYADSMKELSDTYSNNSSTVYDYKSRAYSLIPEQNREELSEADKNKAHKAEVKQQLIEGQLQIDAFDRELAALTEKINIANENYNTADNEVQKQDEIIRKEDELIVDLNLLISSMESKILSATTEAEKNKYRTQKDEYEAKKRDAENRKQDANISKLRAENDKKLAKSQMEIAKAQKDNVEAEKQEISDTMKKLKDSQETVAKDIGETLKKAFTDIVKSIIDTLTSIPGELMSTFQDATQDVFGTIEETQKALGKQLNMDNNEYKEYIDDLQKAAEQAGLAIDSVQVEKLAQSIGDAGITNTKLMNQLAVNEAKLDETGSYFSGNENFYKTLQTMYHDTIYENGGGEEAEEKALEVVDSLYNVIMGTEAAVIDKYGSASALANGGLTELINKFLPKLNNNEISEDSFEKVIGSTAAMMQAMENFGLDSSKYIDILSNMDVTKDYSQMTAEEQAFIEISGYDKETIHNMVNAGRYDELLSSFMTNMSKVYDANGNITDTTYLGKAYASSLDTQEIMTMVNKTDRILEEYEKNKDIDISSYAEQQNQALKDGTYLTKKETLQKERIGQMEDMGQKLQDMTYGDFWMKEGFGAINSGINSGMNYLVSLFGGSEGIANSIVNKLTSAFSGSGGGLLGSGGILGALSGGSTALNLLGGVAGVGMVGHSIYRNAQESDSTGETIANVFSDPETYAGIGTTLGSAIAGPLGGVIGGAIGAGAAKLGNLWADSISDEEFLEQMKKEEESALMLQQAAQSLSDAADKHSQTATYMKENIDKEEQSLKNMNDDQKEIWLEQLLASDELTSEQKDLLKNENDSNTKFAEAIKIWKDNELKKIELENLLSKGATDLQSLGSVVGVDDYSNYDTYSETGIEGAKQIIAGKYGADDINNSQQRASIISQATGRNTEDVMNDESLNKVLYNLNEEEFLKYLNDIEKHQADVNSLLSNPEDIKNMYDDIGKYTELKNMDNKEYTNEDRIRAYLQDVDSDLFNTYTKEQQDEAVSIIADSFKRYGLDNEVKGFEEEYKEANAEFIEKWNDILQNNKDLLTYDELVKEYMKKYEVSERDLMGAIGGLTISDDRYVLVDDKGEEHNYIDEYVPNLQKETDKKHYDIRIFKGKYATGLDYVPYDEFPAILHEGEMVLTKKEAEQYREINEHIEDFTDKFTNFNNKKYNEHIEDFNNKLTDFTDNKDITDKNNKKIEDFTDRLIDLSDKKDINSYISNINDIMRSTNILNSMNGENNYIGNNYNTDSNTNSAYNQIINNMKGYQNNTYATPNDTETLTSQKHDAEDIKLDTSPITESIDSQTNKIIELLTKILNRLNTQRPMNVNRNNSLVQMDSNIYRM